MWIILWITKGNSKLQDETKKEQPAEKKEDEGAIEECESKPDVEMTGK